MVAWMSFAYDLATSTFCSTFRYEIEDNHKVVWLLPR